MLTKKKQDLIYVKLLLQNGHQQDLDPILKNNKVSSQSELIDWILFFKEDENIQLTKKKDIYTIQLTRKGLDYIATFDKANVAAQEKKEAKLKSKDLEIQALKQQLQGIQTEHDKELAAQTQDFQDQLRQKERHISVVYFLAFALAAIFMVMFFKRAF